MKVWVLYIQSMLLWNGLSRHAIKAMAGLIQDHGNRVPWGIDALETEYIVALREEAGFEYLRS